VTASSTMCDQELVAAAAVEAAALERREAGAVSKSPAARTARHSRAGRTAARADSRTGRKRLGTASGRGRTRRGPADRRTDVCGNVTAAAEAEIYTARALADGVAAAYRSAPLGRPPCGGLPNRGDHRNESPTGSAESTETAASAGGPGRAWAEMCQPLAFSYASRMLAGTRPRSLTS
jgi:hypothetical protein